LNLEDSQSAASESGTGIWRNRLQIHSYDVDFRKLATPEALCRIFLEAAWNHAERLGFGYSTLAAQKQLWVLSRLLVQIDVYPGWGDTVELKTWPRGVNGAFAMRDFEIGTLDGQLLAAGVSGWLVLDAAAHRPQRVDKLLFRIPSLETPPALPREPKRLVKPENGTTKLNTKVCYSDIDVNGHVNSARYIGWLLDSYPAVFHERHLLHSLELNYVGESHWADTLSVWSAERGPMEFAHSIVKSDLTEVCRAELGWRSSLADGTSSGDHQ
jgi:acyl-ACP thioesterase